MSDGQRCDFPSCSSGPSLLLTGRYAGKVRTCGLCPTHELRFVRWVESRPIDDLAFTCMLDAAARFIGAERGRRRGVASPPDAARPPEASGSPSTPQKPAPEQAGSAPVSDLGGER